MVEHDTIELLKECDAGIKTGIHSIDYVIDKIDDHKLKTILQNSKEKHKEIELELGDSLRSYGEEEKEPSPMATGMSWLKTNMKMTMNDTDSTASGLIVDGCNMGIKTLQRYINQYENANESSKNLANRIIKIEESLAEDMKPYL